MDRVGLVPVTLRARAYVRVIRPETDPHSEAREQWHRWASMVADGLGRGLDHLITPVVIAFNMVGYKTTGSCEGHFSSGAWWPWVDIEWADTLPVTLRPLLQSLERDTGVDIKGERLTAGILRLSPRDAPGEEQWLRVMPAADADRLRAWQRELPLIVSWLEARVSAPAPLPPWSGP